MAKKNKKKKQFSSRIFEFDVRPPLIPTEHPSAGTLPSKSYNVILIGDSSVGKTSFMKRVQTGTFSLDLPASVGKTSIFPPSKHVPANDEELTRNQMNLVGTDSCVSSVLVDGKRVSLQLWDTAGQER